MTKESEALISALLELNPSDNPLDDYELPSYKTPGSVLFRYFKDEFGDSYEVYAYDQDACPFWIEEGLGISYWLEEWVELEQEGYYVVEGITGAYYRGTWGQDDDDEEFYPGLVRYATDEEIEEAK